MFHLGVGRSQIEWKLKVKTQISVFPWAKIGQNDHSNPYIESTTVLSDMPMRLHSRSRGPSAARANYGQLGNAAQRVFSKKTANASLRLTASSPPSRTTLRPTPRPSSRAALLLPPRPPERCRLQLPALQSRAAAAASSRPFRVALPSPPHPRLSRRC